MKNYIILLALLLISIGCSPLKSSPNEEKHQLELTLHEIQTNIDDLKHDVVCFKSEIQILDDKVQQEKTSQENQKLRSTQESIEQKIVDLEKTLEKVSQTQSSISNDLEKISSFSQKVTLSLSQYKEKIAEIEKGQLLADQKLSKISNLKNTLESLAKSIHQQSELNIYKVKPGDSLEKIAKKHKTNVETLRKLNALDQDLIVIGQELKIP